MNTHENLVAYLATITSIVLLTMSAAAVCLFANVGHDLAQIVAALGFISASATGLVGIAGTFKSNSGMSQKTASDMLKKIPPTDNSPSEADGAEDGTGNAT